MLPKYGYKLTTACYKFSATTYSKFYLFVEYYASETIKFLQSGAPNVYREWIPIEVLFARVLPIATRAENKNELEEWKSPIHKEVVA